LARRRAATPGRRADVIAASGIDAIVPPIRGRNRIVSRSPGRFVTLALGVWLALAGAVVAAPFDFAPAPQTDLNRVYRVDKATGEVAACQFQLKEGGVGVTVCFPPGEGAGAQAPSDYTLMPSRHEREGGIFRVNIRTGEMSICYVFDDKTVCTPQAK
jgi:hypothetical protein